MGSDGKKNRRPVFTVRRFPFFLFNKLNVKIFLGF